MRVEKGVDFLLGAGGYFYPSIRYIEYGKCNHAHKLADAVLRLTLT